MNYVKENFLSKIATSSSINHVNTRTIMCGRRRIDARWRFLRRRFYFLRDVCVLSSAVELHTHSLTINVKRRETKKRYTVQISKSA